MSELSASNGKLTSHQVGPVSLDLRAPGALVRERSRMQGLQRRRERRSRQAGCCVYVQRSSSLMRVPASLHARISLFL